MDMERILCKALTADHKFWVMGYLVGSDIHKLYLTEMQRSIRYKARNSQHPHYNLPAYLDDFSDTVLIDCNSICLCTGITDCEGTKIFENDEVEWYEDYDDLWGVSQTGRGEGTVVWDSELARYAIVVDGDDEKFSLDPSDWQDFKVIGNTYNKLAVKEEMGNA